MAPSFFPTSGGLKRRRVVIQPKLNNRANDGFWTPGMGEAGFDDTPSATLADTAPTAGPEEQATVFVTVTAKVLAPAATVTQLVDELPSSTLDLPSSTALDSTIPIPTPASSSAQSERVFGVASSAAAPGKVLQPWTASEESTPTTASTSQLGSTDSFETAATSATVSSLSEPTSTPSTSISSERIFGAPSSSAVVVKVLQLATSSDEAASTLEAAETVAPVETASDAATTSERVFSPASSSAVLKVLQPSSSSSDALEPSATAISATTSAPVEAASSTSTADKVFNPKWSSAIAAVVSPSGAEAATPTLSSTASSSGSLSSIIVGSPSASATTSLAVSLSSASSSASLPASSVDQAIPPSQSEADPASPASSGAASNAVDASSVSKGVGASSRSSSSSSAATAVPRTSDATASFFNKLGQSPANIALTSIVSLAILAVLLGLLAFFVRRCVRRKRRAQLGNVLGSQGGPSPPDFGEPWERFENVADGSPMMVQRSTGPVVNLLDVDSPGIEEEEVWRRRMSTLNGGPASWRRPAERDNLAAVDSSRDSGAATNGDWESLRRIHQEEGAYRRGSESTVGTGILYPGQTAYPAYGAYHLPNRAGASSPAPFPPAVLADSTSAANAAESARPRINPHHSTGSASVYSTLIPGTPVGSAALDQTPFMPYRMERVPQLSRPSAIPLSPSIGANSPSSATSPTSPTSPDAALLQRREILSYPTPFTPGIVRTLPSISGPSGVATSSSPPPSPSKSSPPSTWKESLERVMGNAADLLVSSMPATAKETDNLTTFPTPASPPRRPFVGRTASTGLRPNRPPPLTFHGTPLSPVAPSPRLPSPPAAVLTSFLGDSNSNRSSSGSSSSIDGPLVSPTTLAFPQRALVSAEQVNAVQGVPTSMAEALAERRGSKPDSTTSSLRSSSHGHTEPISFAPRPLLLPSSLSTPEVETLADASPSSPSNEPAVNPFIPARPSRRAISIPAHDSTTSTPPTAASFSSARRTRTRSRSLLSASAISAVMGRQRSASVGDGREEEDHGVSSFSDDDSLDGEDSLSSLSHASTSSGDGAHPDADEGIPGGRRTRPTSVHDRFVGSLMIERRRRSLASLSGLSHAGGSVMGSRPSSVRIASRADSVGPSTGSVRERLSMIEVR